MPGFDLGLKGSVAAVTGGANGIGFAIARLLADSGGTVWILDREREGGEAAAAQIGARALAVDVADRQSLDAAFAQIGTPDIVMANAGVVVEANFLDQAAEAWERTLAVNLSGMFHTVQAAARLM